MGAATGGFWSSGFGNVLAGILGPIADSAVSREVTSNENDLSRQHDEYMARVQQSNALQQMRIQQEFEKNMSNTAYQRAVADMQAAGLNPASMAGSSAIGASTPGTSTPGASAAHSSAIGAGYGQTGIGSSLMSSAFNAILSKDRDAADIAKSELIDNARHAHRMEELNEMKELNAAKAAYFDEKATTMRYKRLGIYD